MTKVSIIIPVYNAEKTLSKCLLALIEQTYKDLEIICVNDGSSDSSHEILQHFAEKDSRIKIITQENSGPAKTRNLAINNANGEFLMFCDADDSYSHDMVEKMVDAIVKHNVDIAMCNCKIISSGIANIQPQESNEYHKLKLKDLHKINSTNIKNINTVLWNKILRKDFIEKHNIKYPEKYEQDDSIFIQKYMLNAKTYYGLDETLYNYVVNNPDSIMGKVYSKTNTKSKYDFIFAWQDFYNYIAQNRNNKNIRKHFINENFHKWKIYYSNLADEDKKQAFIYMRNFIKKNKCLQKHSCFKQITQINDFNTFQKEFYLLDKRLKWYQLFFSVRNTPNKTHKTFRILGLKFNIKRNKK